MNKNLKCPRCKGPVKKNGTHVGGANSARQGKQKYKCKNRECNWQGESPAGIFNSRAGIDTKRADALHRLMEGKRRGRYIITAAQNATPVFKPFLKNLLAYCADRDATLIVLRYRYKNPTSHWSKSAEDDDWWAPEIHPYIMDVRTDINANLTVLADISTQPTAVSPLSGFESMTGGRSAILGHPKIELKVVPTPQHKLPKILVTTGAVTVPNYIPSKAGKKGEFHHVYGAAVVEIDGDTFHLRQIYACRDGSFIDLDREYRRGKARPAPRAAALVMGDTHREFVDPSVVNATLRGPKSMVAVLKPRELVWHDVHDFYARNHHHRGEHFINFVKHHERKDNVERDLDATFAFLDEFTPAGTRSILVPSNHPDALARWVKEADPKSDPENAEFWCRTYLAMCHHASWSSTSGAGTCDPFTYWAKRKLKHPARFLFLNRDDSYTIKGIAVDMHGDIGPNGMPGSIKAFARIGIKNTVAHRHTPGIFEGSHQTGTSSYRRLGYNRGPSSWLQTHDVIYGNGKRSLLTIVGGEWRLDM